LGIFGWSLTLAAKRRCPRRFLSAYRASTFALSSFCSYNPALLPAPGSVAHGTRNLTNEHWSKHLSRVINPDSVGKERTRLSKGIVLALRELAKQTEPTAYTRDLAAFIALALQTIAEGIDASVQAWEKRDYWVKADRFRMEWMWAGATAAKMKAAVLADDWATVASLMPTIAAKFGKIKVSDNHRLGKPWLGAYNSLR
jgi:hypothetical protein